MTCISNFGFLVDYGVTAIVSPCGHELTNPPCIKSTLPYQIDYDLGSNYALDYSKPDFIHFKDIHHLISVGTTTIRVRGSNSAGFGTYDEVILSPLLADLNGLTSHDYGLALSFTTMRRYWRIIIQSTSAASISMPIVTFGSKLAFNKSPAFPLDLDLPDGITEGLKSLFTGKLRFKGVTSAKKTDFDSKILEYADVTPIILIDADNVVFWGLKWVRVFITDYSARIASTGLNYDILISFQELA